MKLRFFFLPWLFLSVILGLLLYCTNEDTYNNIFGLKFDIIALLFLSIISGAYYFIILAIIPYKRKLIPNIISSVKKVDLFIVPILTSISILLLLFLYNIDYIKFDDIDYKFLIFESIFTMLSVIPFIFFYLFYLLFGAVLDN